MSSVTTHEETQVARPLKVLVQLIREDLKRGDEMAAQAAKAAGGPYYTAAGAKMLEAKGQMPHGEFTDWISRNFKIGIRHAQQYMSLARATLDLEKRGATRISDLTSFREAVRTHTTNVNYGKPASWRVDVKENIQHAREDAFRLAREANLSRQQERDAEHKLALRLIDIGFKVLVKELHPDKGGSKDAMSRLSRVRDRLKQHA